MIAEDKSLTYSKPDFDVPSGLLVKWIEKSLIITTSEFLRSIGACFNERQYTQEFVAELERTLRRNNIPICVEREYSDIYTPNADTSRSVDFYFYPVEHGASRKSLFSVEAKRLPTPGGTDREKEYVFGNEGGIERFKREYHGKGLPNCGMIAFVEKRDFDYWYSTINSWITDASSFNYWSPSECLSSLISETTWAKSISIVNRKSSILKLIHFWIKVK